MPETFFGLPIHPLVVHATVVAVPLTALVLALSLLLPRFRDWAGPLPLALAALSTVLAPLSTSSGESLEEMVGESSLVEKHAQLGEGLVWWCVGMLVVAAAAYLLRRRGTGVTRNLGIALAVAGVVAAGGTLVQTALIGHSGAKAAWSDVVSSSSARADTGNG